MIVGLGYILNIPSEQKKDNLVFFTPDNVVCQSGYTFVRNNVGDQLKILTVKWTTVPSKNKSSPQKKVHVCGSFSLQNHAQRWWDFLT